MLSNKTKEAIAAFLNGAKIRKSGWEENEFIFINKDGWIEDEMETTSGYFDIEPNIEYEIYEEPREKLKLKNLRVGDILEGIMEDRKSKIIGICGEVIAISTIDKESQASEWFTWFSIKTLNNLEVKKCK
jgi:hypothetical protein